jgi:hypothetical protein
MLTSHDTAFMTVHQFIPRKPHQKYQREHSVGLMRHVRQGSEISLKYSFQESKFGQY